MDGIWNILYGYANTKGYNSGNKAKKKQIYKKEWAPMINDIKWRTYTTEHMKKSKEANIG